MTIPSITRTRRTTTSLVIISNMIWRGENQLLTYLMIAIAMMIGEANGKIYPAFATWFHLAAHANFPLTTIIIILNNDGGLQHSLKISSHRRLWTILNNTDNGALHCCEMLPLCATAQEIPSFAHHWTRLERKRENPIQINVYIYSDNN